MERMTMPEGENDVSPGLRSKQVRSNNGESPICRTSLQITPAGEKPSLSTL